MYVQFVCIPTNLCDEYSELIQITVTFRTHSQFTYHLIEPLSSSHWVLHSSVETNC